LAVREVIEGKEWSYGGRRGFRQANQGTRCIDGVVGDEEVWLRVKLVTSSVYTGKLVE